MLLCKRSAFNIGVGARGSIPSLSNRRIKMKDLLAALLSNPNVVRQGEDGPELEKIWYKQKWWEATELAKELAKELS